MKTLIASLSVMLALAAAPAMAVDNPFTMSGAASMQVAENATSNEKSDDAAMKECMAKKSKEECAKEGKCGQGKCGDSMKKEAKCGQGKK
jgi:uncharacterized low-complexity protein